MIMLKVIELRLKVKQMKASPGKTHAFTELEHWGHLTHKRRPLAYTSAVQMQGQAIYVGGSISVSIELSTELEVECSRCLKTMVSPVRISESFELREEPERGFQGVLLDEFSYEHGVNELDLMPCLERLISGSLPSKPLCRADCKGLCPTCGQDLNAGPCPCPKQRSTDPRLEKLKELLT